MPLQEALVVLHLLAVEVARLMQMESTTQVLAASTLLRTNVIAMLSELALSVDILVLA